MARLPVAACPLDGVRWSNVVPSSHVAEYVREQHRYWVRTRTEPPDPSNKMRRFRIHPSDPLGFKDNWQLLAGVSPTPQQSHVMEPWVSHEP
jgi:hypothetical protein